MLPPSKPKRPSLLAAIGLTPLLLPGCASDLQKPQVPALGTSTSFTSPVSVNKALARLPWWQTGLPPELQPRVEKMLQANTEIRIAAQDVAEQRAQLDLAEAQRWVDISADASGNVQTSNGDRSTRAQLGVDLRMPLDVFERLKDSRDAAAFDLAASLAQYEQQRLDQVERFVLSYIDAAESKQLLELLDQQIDTVSTLLRLTELRFGQGLVSSVDVLQQREQLATLRQQPARVELQLVQAISAMDELRGQLPGSSTEIPPGLPAMAEEFAIDQPAQLLLRHPRLIEKRAALLASDKRYVAALNERLPDVSLSSAALLRLVAGDSTRILSAAIEAAVALFDSGRQDAIDAQKRAALERAGIEYLQTWLATVRDANDLVEELRANKALLQLSENRGKVASALFDSTRRRYERGISDYLPVLAALSSLQQQQRDHLALQAQRLRLIVRLHSAMGLPAPPAEDKPAGEPA